MKNAKNNHNQIAVSGKDLKQFPGPSPQKF